MTARGLDETMTGKHRLARWQPVHRRSDTGLSALCCSDCSCALPRTEETRRRLRLFSLLLAPPRHASPCPLAPTCKTTPPSISSKVGARGRAAFGASALAARPPPPGRACGGAPCRGKSPGAAAESASLCRQVPGLRAAQRRRRARLASAESLSPRAAGQLAVSNSHAASGAPIHQQNGAYSPRSLTRLFNN